MNFDFFVFFLLCVRAVDCKVSDFTWGACSALCNGGVQTGARTVLRPEAHGGLACPALRATQPCNLQACVATLAPPTPAPAVCFSNKVDGFIGGLVNDITYRGYDDAEMGCRAVPQCTGITYEPATRSYTLRGTPGVFKSPAGEISWVKQTSGCETNGDILWDCHKCHRSFGHGHQKCRMCKMVHVQRFDREDEREREYEREHEREHEHEHEHESRFLEVKAKAQAAAEVDDE